MKLANACIAFSFLLLSACAQQNYSSKSSVAETSTEPDYRLALNSHFAKIQGTPDSANKDRAAILAMQGEYKVSFDFKETVALQSDYERRPPKNSGAYETVVVVKDTPEHIILQHLLVVGDDYVVKHWRQDWFYQAEERFEFVADQTWQIKPLEDIKRKGFWTQCVYEVSDSPRYCGTGKWNHRYGVSTWTSDRTWRPLPRREYTTRDDYNALNVENRHTVTPLGWTHEQDNTKTIRNGSKTQSTLVREFGFNDYRRIDGYDFSPAYRYWEKTANYWQQVRGLWSDKFAKNNVVKLKTEVDGMPIIEATFGHAESIEKGNDVPTENDIKDVFDKWVSAGRE